MILERTCGCKYDRHLGVVTFTQRCPKHVPANRLMEDWEIELMVENKHVKDPARELDTARQGTPMRRRYYVLAAMCAGNIVGTASIVYHWHQPWHWLAVFVVAGLAMWWAP